MNDDRELLERHLNGDLDAAEQAAFFLRVQASPDLRALLAERARDEVLLSELLLESRAVRTPRRLPWAALAAAGILLAVLGVWLRAGSAPLLRAVSAQAMLERDGIRRELRAGEALESGDRVEGVADFGRLRLEGVLAMTEEGPRLERGSAELLGSAELATAQGPVRVVSGRAWVESGEDLRVEVSEGRVSVRGAEVAAGLSAWVGGSVRTETSVARERVREAARRAGAWLEAHRSELLTPVADGTRRGAPPPRTYAELALLALRRAGYAREHPLVRELEGRAVGRPLDSTYAAALQALALVELDPAGHAGRLREIAAALASGQAANGQWDYHLAPGAAGGDASVSAYAALAFRALHRAGIAVDREAAAKARRWWLEAQNEDGGWGYHDSGSRSPDPGPRPEFTVNTSYGSTTASGLASLGALDEVLGRDERSSAAAARGLRWLDERFEADVNPSRRAGFVTAHWRYAAARAARIHRVGRFSGREVYPVLAEAILQEQRADGSWSTERSQFMPKERTDVVDTCLALLVLIP